MRFSELPEGAYDELDELLLEAETRGIDLSASWGALRFSAPTGALTHEFRNRLYASRADLVRAISGPAYEARGPSPYSPLPFHNVELLQKIRAGILGTSFTNSSWIMTLEGPLDVDALIQSFHHLVRIHAVLGARLEDCSDGVRLVFNQGVFPQIADFSGEAEVRRADCARECVEALLTRPFDLQTDTLFRPILVKIAAQKHLVGFVMHHIVSDGLSVSLGTADLWHAYFAIRAGSNNLPETPALLYSDYVAALNEWLLGPGLRYRRNYWKKQLTNAPVVRLPADFDVDSSAQGRVEDEPFSLGPQLTASIVRLASSLSTSVFTILLVVKAIAFYRHLKMIDVVIRLMHNGRDDPSLTRVIGSFQNQLNIRLELLPTMSFRAVAQQAHRTILTAFERQVPHGYVLHHLQDIKAPSAFPELNFLDFRSGGKGQSELPGLSATPFTKRTPAVDTTKQVDFPSLSMVLVMVDTDLHGHLKYFGPSYLPQTIKSFITSFCAIAEQAVSDPEFTLSTMSFD